MKVSIGSKIFEGPWGGGNLFVKNLKNYLESKGVKVIFDLYDADIDLIVLTDPRKSSYSSTYTHKDIMNYLKYINEKAVVVQRFNECDERKNTKDVNNFMIQANVCSDKNIFVSNWLEEIYKRSGLTDKENQIIMTGADKEIFNNKDFHKWDEKSKFRIVTHHWGTNINKGFNEYKKLDSFIGEGDNSKTFEFTFIGNLPEDFEFIHSNHIEPLHGKNLSNELKRHHLYLTASKNEPSGNHHIEAAQCGLPILYLNSGGIPEFCKGFGLPFDEKNLFESLYEIKENYFDYREKVKSYPYDANKMCKEYYDLILDLIEKRDLYVEKRILSNPQLIENYSYFLFKQTFGRLIHRNKLLHNFYNYLIRGYLKFKSIIIK